MSLSSYLIDGLFFVLVFNLLYQWYMKGYYHFKFYRIMGIIKASNETFLKILLTSTFYKYPLLMLPYISKYNSLNVEQKLIYSKVRRKIISGIISFLLLFLFVLFLIGKSKMKYG